jgi:hypothetical protein
MMSRKEQTLVFATATIFVFGFLAFVALPRFIRVRTTSSSNACVNNLRQIDGAKQQWALEHSADGSNVPSWKDLGPYIGRKGDGSDVVCPHGGSYSNTLGPVSNAPTCSVCGSFLH